MNTSKYVIINNRVYNAITGLPSEDYAPADIANLEQVAEKATKELVTRGTSISAIHQPLQKSQTLRRKYVKQPATGSIPTSPTEETVTVRNFSPINSKRFETERSDKVAKIAAPVTVNIKTQATRPADIHPLVSRAQARPMDIAAPRRQRTNAMRNVDLQTQLASAPEKASLKSAQVLKNEAIAEAMNKEVDSKKQKRSRVKAKKRGNPFMRLTGAAVPAIAILMLSGYFTYLSMPNLSIKMAAVQSGVDAKYPGYRPDGYALSGPINFGNGEVSMKFAYANEGHDFTLTQQKSNWNSSSVKQLFAASPEDVITTAVDGLTIYSQGGRAIWVNGGILYTIDGQANLSNHQIQKIATSL